MRDAVDVLLSGSSPFDLIVKHNEVDGTEYWSAREMMGLLDYTRWENFKGVIKRAKSACRNSGHKPEDHFRDITKMIDIGKGGQRIAEDTQMDRFACYFVAMNGDPEKRAIAAAQKYFVVKTRAAEIGAIEAGERAAPAATQPNAPQPLGWTERFRRSLAEHFCYMSRNHLDRFSVVSAAPMAMLMMEDILIGHALPVGENDLPDGSIGRRWAAYRKSKGRNQAAEFAPLLMPSRGIDVMVAIYPIEEKREFEHWLMTVYIPEYLPTYYLSKKEFKEYGKLPPASAADHTSRKLAGRAALIPAKVRHQLMRVGGYAPVGTTEPPALPKPKFDNPHREDRKGLPYFLDDADSESEHEGN